MPKMIGLHHHMSYSPASAGAVKSRTRTGSGQDNKIHKSSATRRTVSVSAGKRNGHSNDDDWQCEQEDVQGHGSKQRQQFIMAELAAAGDDSIRALRVHRIRDDDEEQRPRTKTQTGGRQRRPFEQQTELIQVQAHQIMPTIVIDSVDKYNNCRRQDAATRSRGLRNSPAAAAARNAVHQDNKRNGDQRNGNNLLITSTNADDQHLNFLCEQQRRESAAGGLRSKADNNQVVLIMSDTSDGTSGVPVIGRLLPSKSFGQNQSRVGGGGGGARRDPSPVFVRHAELPSSQMGGQMAPQAAVVGRRSHRMLDQAGARVHRVSKRSDDNLISQQQQPRLPTHPTIDVQTTSMSWLEPMPARRLSTAKPKKIVGCKRSAGSSSCSSLVQPVTSVVPLAQTMEPPCLDACCRARRRGPQMQDSLIEHSLTNIDMPPPGLCMMPCCQFEPLDSHSRGRGRSFGRRQDHATCKANEQIVNVPSHLLSNRRSSSLCRSSGSEQLFGQSNSSLMEDRNASRQSCQYYGPRPSRVQSSANHMPAKHNQHQGPPLVPCKPIYNGLLHLVNGRQRELMLQYEPDPLVHKQQLEREQDSEAVTQMYESLAAELKAKLGNPNRAPILLPPKDYDTLCRKQGRLCGIELRRSTNPQLVGPNLGTASGAIKPPASNNNSTQVTTTSPTATNPSGGPNKDSGRAKSIADETEASPSSAGSSPKISAQGNSTRSSGRSSRELDHSSSNYAEDHSNHLRRGDSLQMSRSNSSSGLGSISISASSPDQNARSSPSQHSGSGSEPDIACIKTYQANRYDVNDDDDQQANGSMLQAKLVNDEFIMFGSSMINARTSAKALQTNANTRPSSSPERTRDEARAIGVGGTKSTTNKSAAGQLNGRVEVPLKVNNDRGNGNTYLATKQIIY